MFSRFCTFNPLLIALVVGPQFILAQSPGPLSSNSDSIIQNRSALIGVLESNNGQLRLNLTNNSTSEFRGTARISLGNDSDQKEIGQVLLVLPPQETSLLKLTSIGATGSHYKLTIYDQEGALVFYKIAPIKRVSDSSSAIAVAVTPVSPTRTKSNSAPPASASPRPATTESSPRKDNEVASAGSSEVKLQVRLVQGEDEGDPSILVFDLSSKSPVNDATLTITVGKLKDGKQVSINRQSTIQFKLPDLLPDQLEEERLSYVLALKDGRVLAKGEKILGQLMAEDSVTVTEIRTDRQSYDPGDQVKLTVLLEGESRNGYRIEVAAKDGEGKIFFRDEKQSTGNDQKTKQEFNLSIPREAPAPLILEFRILDGESGQMFDSGEREIPVKSSKSVGRQPS